MKYIKLFEDFETEDNYTHTPFKKGNSPLSISTVIRRGRKEIESILKDLFKLDIGHGTKNKGVYHGWLDNFWTYYYDINTDKIKMYFEVTYDIDPESENIIIKPTESDFKYFKYDKNKFIDYVIRANNLVDMGKMMKKVNEEFKNEVHNLPGKIFDLKEMVEKFLDKVGIEYSYYHDNTSYLYDGKGKDLGKFSFEISNKVIDTEDGPRRVGIIIPLLGMGGYFSNMDEFSTYITARYGIDMGKVMKKINQ